MNFSVINKEISVGNIRILGVSSSSIFIVGDAEVIHCSALFDTPPETIIVGPLVPLSSLS